MWQLDALKDPAAAQLPLRRARPTTQSAVQTWPVARPLPLPLDPRQLFEDSDQLPLVQPEAVPESDAVAQPLRPRAPFPPLGAGRVAWVVPVLVEPPPASSEVAPIAAH